MRRLLNRRLFGASLIATTGVLCVQRMRTSGRIRDRRKPQSRAAILDADRPFGITLRQANDGAVSFFRIPNFRHRRA